MNLAFLEGLIIKLLNPIPMPVFIWGFILILSIVFIVLFSKIDGLKGE